MKDKIIEIVGFGIEPEKAEIIAQQLMDLFAEKESKSMEELIWEKKFPDEDYNPDDFYDLARENPLEYLKLCLEICSKEMIEL